MTTTTHSHTALDSLEVAVSGRVLAAGTPGFAELATPWNVARAANHIAVVEVLDAADVAATVRWAAEQGVQVSVQATGHGALSTTAPTVLVQTGRLDELTISAEGHARIGAGVQWARVIEAGAELGFAGLAGSAPHVGVVGFVTGGGLGPVARTFGVTSDHVTAFDVVTGDGELRRATPSENPALFWGLRGGKGALGIVTAVEMDLVPLTEVFGGCLYYAAEDIPRVLEAWRRWTPRLPEQATTSVAILRLPPMPGVPEPLAGQVTLALRFAWVGEESEARNVLSGILPVASSVLGGLGPMPYSGIGAIHADPVDPMPVHEASVLLRELPVEATEALLALAGADAECPQVIVELRHLGGAIDREPLHASAYSQRGAAYNLMTIGIDVPPVIEATAVHAAAVLAAVEPWSTGGCLPNFAASADPAEVARKYDSETLTRLATLAATYDPRGVIAAADPVRAACLAG